MAISSDNRARSSVIAAAILITCCAPILLSAAGVSQVSGPATGIDTVSVDTMATTDGALILESANSNENIYHSATGEFISYLRGNVVFRYEDLRISADSATWRRNDGIVDFSDRVRVDHRGQLMTCDRLHFVRDNNVLTASGNVFYRDSARITFIRGETAEYMTDTKEALLRGNPLLTRLDSANAEADTIFLRGKLVRYSDSLKIATVTDSVSVTRGGLVATGQFAQYFADDERAILRIDPVIYYEGHKIVGDSVDIFLGKEKFESAVIVGNTHGHYMEIADSTADTTVTNIWSDSLHLSMFESGKINAMKAFGSARGDYSETGSSSNSVTSTTFSSDSMHMFMFESGKIRGIKAFGSARGSYSETSTSISAQASQPPPAPSAPPSLTQEPAPTQTRSATTTAISSDSLHMLMFETGKIRAIRAFGNAHGRSAEWSAAAAKDSSITHIWSDSLRVAMTDAGKIRVMRAFGGDSADVRSLNFTAGDSARANEITGRRMTLLFGPAGKIDRAVVTGDARSLYHLEESDGGGLNRASGDRIVVTFSAGKAQRIRVLGNVRGYYAP